MRAPQGIAYGWLYDPPRSQCSKVQMGSQHAEVVVRSEIGYLVVALAKDLEHFCAEAATPGTCWGLYARPIRGTADVASFHGYGLAVDYNAPRHPLGKINTWGVHQDQVSPIAAHYGFRWGGSYVGRKDEMHFEYLGSPAQALEMSRHVMEGSIPAPTPKPLPPAVDPDYAELRRRLAFTYAASWPVQGLMTPGKRGLDVALLQNTLNLIMRAGLGVDGIYGTGTEKAVASFQTLVKADGGAMTDPTGYCGNYTKIWIIKILQDISRGVRL